MFNSVARHKKIVFFNLTPTVFLLLIFFAAYSVFLLASVNPSLVSMTGDSSGWTLEYYKKYFSSTNELNALYRTLKISIELTLASILIGYPMSYVMIRCNSSMLRKFLIVSLVVTFLSGSVTRAYAWLILLGNRGLINTLLLKVGITDAPLRLVYNETGVFISLLHFVLPFFVLTMLGPLKNIPSRLEDAAINLGASRLRAFCLVTLPLSVPGLVAASSLTFAVALSSFLFPLVLGGGRFSMVSNSIYEHIFQAFNVPMAAASAVIFLLITLFFFWIFSVAQKVTSVEHKNN